MLHLEHVEKRYRAKQGEIRALDDVSLTIESGEFVVVRGPSGSGKTTLLMAVGGMLRPTSGRVRFETRDLYAMRPRERAAFRRENVGFVFQMFHLVPYLNVFENVLLAANGSDKKEAAAFIDQLGLTGRAHHRPGQLSAGERQRTAVARALLNRPKLVLADEPTGNLDPENAHEVMCYLAEYRDAGGTVIVVTHGYDADEYSDRVIGLREGRINSETG